MFFEMPAGSIGEIFGPLPNVLALSLDVREVVVQISALARQTVPHDRLVFGLISQGRERFRILAHSEDESGGHPARDSSPGLARAGGRGLGDRAPRPNAAREELAPRGDDAHLVAPRRRTVRLATRRSALGGA
jgi:hypothetical protein